MLIQITEKDWINTDLIKYITINSTKDSKVSEMCIYMIEGPSMAWHEPMLFNKSIEQTISNIKGAMNK